MDLVTAEMVTSMSTIPLENVFEETFSSQPLYAAFLVESHHVAKNRNSPTEVINRGLEVICNPLTRKSPRIQSQLRQILAEAASGSRSDNVSAPLMYLDKLLASVVRDT